MKTQYGLYLAAALLALNGAAPEAMAQTPAETGSAHRLLSLRDGSLHNGELVEKAPGDHITLKLTTGDLRRFEWSEVLPSPTEARDRHPHRPRWKDPASTPFGVLSHSYKADPRLVCAGRLQRTSRRCPAGLLARAIHRIVLPLKSIRSGGRLGSLQSVLRQTSRFLGMRGGAWLRRERRRGHKTQGGNRLSTSSRNAAGADPSCLTLRNAAMVRSSCRRYTRQCRHQDRCTA